VGGGAQAAQPANAFRFELRSATRAEHQALDGHPAFEALTAGSLGIAGYRRLMVLFHGLYAGLDGPLAAASRRFLPATFNYAPRRDIIALDLRSLGVADAEPAPAPEPFATASALCGALYVVEGSLLGGAMLQRSTQALLADHGGRGDGYWRWCRDAGGPRWSATCALIEANAASPPARDEMVDAARRTFRLFSHWFARWRDPSTAVTANMPPC
jgi:heme oxygenase